MQPPSLETLRKEDSESDGRRKRLSGNTVHIILDYLEPLAIHAMIMKRHHRSVRKWIGADCAGPRLTASREMVSRLELDLSMADIEPLAASGYSQLENQKTVHSNTTAKTACLRALDEKDTRRISP